MTGDVFEPKFLLLDLSIPATMFVHFRGKVRHGFARQLTDQSTILAPLNALLYAFSAVPNKPLLDSSMASATLEGRRRRAVR